MVRRIIKNTSLKLLIKAIMITLDKPSFKGSNMAESSNRAFMYGESVFTTLRMRDGNLCDWEFHFDRLKKGVNFLYGPFLESENWNKSLKQRLEECIQAVSGDQVIRLSVYTEQTRGLVRPGITSVHDLRIHHSATPDLTENKMLNLRSCPGPIRPEWWPGFLKAGNYLETILTQKQFLKPGDDEVLFLGIDQIVLESAVANIFVVRNNKLYTAPTGPQVLDGVMRKKVIKEAEHFFDSVEESALSIGELFKAEAVFGTNSVRGPFLIKKLDDYYFDYSQTFLSNFENLRKRVMT
jgi:branched-subunit amino acid aminotransferase/4-amino-4-deoxychorismate lyase